MKLASVFAFLPWAVTASVASEGTFYRSGMYVKPYLELLSTERELMGTADTCPPGSFDNEVNDEEIAKGNKYSQGSKCKLLCSQIILLRRNFLTLDTPTK